EDKHHVFQQIARLFENHNRLAPTAVLASLMAREALGSTALGAGVAIPHGRVKGLREAVGAFAKLSPPLDFAAPDGKPVNLMFVLLVPERATDLHLQILGELAELFCDKALREHLLETEDPVRLHDLLVNYASHPHH